VYEKIRKNIQQDRNANELHIVYMIRIMIVILNVVKDHRS